MPQHSSPERASTINGSSDPLLDDVNVALLAELQADPRLSMSALGRRVGMSSPAVTERIRRLEEAGVIAGYRMVVDPRALGLPECHRITGEDCMLLRVHAADIAQIETVLDQFLIYGQTTTSIVVSTPVPTRPLPLPGPAVRGGAASHSAGVEVHRAGRRR